MSSPAAAKLAQDSTIPAYYALQRLNLAERQVSNSLQRLSTDLRKNAEALRTWGSGEEDDLKDIIGASATLLASWASSLSRFSTHVDSTRDYLKKIWTKEKKLDDLRRRRKSASAEAEAAEKQLSKMSWKYKISTAQIDSLNGLRAEIRSMDSEIMAEEAALRDLKQTITRFWMGSKFSALLECSEKGKIAADFGKSIIGEIVEEKTRLGMARRHSGRQKIKELLSEARYSIDQVVLSTDHVEQNPT